MVFTVVLLRYSGLSASTVKVKQEQKKSTHTLKLWTQSSTGVPVDTGMDSFTHPNNRPSVATDSQRPPSHERPRKGNSPSGEFETEMQGRA